jgi:hypothetical protein
MTSSRTIARIIGPALVAVGVTEAINIGSFAGNAAPVVYLNGMVLFIGGLAIVQMHNRWLRAWPVLVTVTGWALVLGGLARMIAPTATPIGAGAVTDGVLAIVVSVGSYLAWCGYRHQPPG